VSSDAWEISSVIDVIMKAMFVSLQVANLPVFSSAGRVLFI